MKHLLSPLLLALLALAPARAQDRLAELEARLARPDLPPAERRAAERERPRLLLEAGRDADARAAWEGLLRRGEDVAAELLRLSGARLDVAVEPLVAGAPAALRLLGERTGPLVLRLYRVSAAALRAALEADPARGLDAHLRAPPPAALSRVAQWDVAEPAPGAAATTRTPVDLAPGLHLLTVTARGVPLAAPLVVSGALPVTRRAAGPGLLWLVDAGTGAPLPGVALRALDDDGVAGEALGATDPDGLLAWERPAPRAFAWRGDELLVVPLPPPAPPLAAAPPALALDLPAHRPGQALRARATGLRADAPARARLVDPLGVAVQDVAVRSDAAGAVDVTLALPAEAPPGAWTVEVGPARAAARVLPAPVPGVEVWLELPEVVTGPRLTGLVGARLVTGRALEGRAVRWTLRQLEAEPGLEDPVAEGPLPPYALRPVRAGDPGEVLQAGTVRLDARGEAPVDVALPRLARPTLLRLEAEVLLAAHAPGAAPAAVAFSAAGPRDLLLRLAPERQVIGPAATLGVEVRAARLDGRPAGLLDLTLTIEHRADAGATRVEARPVRTDAQGLARTHVVVDAPGALALRLDGHDAQGRPVQALERVRVVAPEEAAAPAPGAAPGAPATARLSLEAPPAPGQTEVAVLAELPFERGRALLLLAPPDGAGALQPRALEAQGGRARLVVPAGDRALELVAVRGGVVHAARLALESAPEPLVVSGRPPARAGAPLSVQVRAGAEGRLARVGAWFLDEPTAVVLARSTPRRADAPATAPGGAPAPPTREAPPPLAWPPLRALGGDAAWTNGAGLGSARPSAALPDRAWALLDARDRRGRVGQAWCLLAARPAPLALRLVGPSHALEGDRGELVARIEVLDRAALPPGAALRVSWRGQGVDLERPRVEGSRPVLLGDPGPAALRVEPAPALRVALGLGVPAQPPSVTPGAARVDVTVEVEGAPLSATATWTAPVQPRGRVESASAAGVVPAGGLAQHLLELPPQHVPGASRLLLAVDVDAATAALSGVAALDSCADPLRGPPRALLARRCVARLLLARSLTPALPAREPRLDEVVGALAAARDGAGAWGPLTARVARALLELRQDGAPVPEALLLPALDALARDPGRSTDGRALLALALGGRLDAATAGGVDVRALPADERPFAARALALAGQAQRATEALALTAGEADAVGQVEARAELLAQLAERDVAPAVQQALLAALLASRQGPGWPDPDDACAAVRALAAVAAREAEGPGTRVLARLEGQPVHEAWSGAGLREWPLDPALVAGSGVARGARLELRASGPRPAAWSLRADALVRGDAPPAPAGLRLSRTLARRGPGGGLEPIGVAGVSAGDALRLELELQGEGGEPPDLRDLLLEVPLPGGCLVEARPPGARVEDGVLRLAPQGPRVVVDLVAVVPGEHRLARARARALRGPARAATSDEQVLRVR